MSKIDKARRGFLKLMPSAPLAATVAAKQAAAAMGRNDIVAPHSVRDGSGKVVGCDGFILPITTRCFAEIRKRYRRMISAKLLSPEYKL